MPLLALVCSTPAAERTWGEDKGCCRLTRHPRQGRAGKLACRENAGGAYSFNPTTRRGIQRRGGCGGGDEWCDVEEDEDEDDVDEVEEDVEED